MDKNSKRKKAGMKRVVVYLSSSQHERLAAACLGTGQSVSAWARGAADKKIREVRRAR